MRILATALLLAFSLGTVASARTMTLDDVKSIVTISDVHLRPDGKEILYIASSGNYKSDVVERSLMLYDLASGTRRVLADDRDGLASPTWSPDGTRIAFVAQRAADHMAQLWVMDMRGGDPRMVSNAPRGVDSYAWRADGSTLLYVTADAPKNESDIKKHLDAFKVGEQAFNVRSAPAVMRVWVADINGGANTPAPSNEQSMPLAGPTINAPDGAMAFSQSDARRPSELYYRPSSSAAAKRLTDDNTAVAALDLGMSESVTWQGPDGSAQSGTLTSPPGVTCAAPKACALVLLIGGGPNGSPDTFSPLAQLLAARGYAVLRPTTTDAIGKAAADDILAGVTDLEARGVVDPTRVAVSGWSYGGYMTAWLIGHEHFWKAAVAGAPITNWVDQYALSERNVLTSKRFGGASPFVGDGAKLYAAASPMTYAWSITTPTLILADVHDAKVPITNSYDLYHALSDRGTPVRFFAYPVAEHFPADPVQQLDIYRRWVDWIATYLK
jgi:dipeptidyl aminopeptidase/acylaminoacyl peptidase